MAMADEQYEVTSVQHICFSLFFLLVFFCCGAHIISISFSLSSPFDKSRCMHTVGYLFGCYVT